MRRRAPAGLHRLVDVIDSLVDPRVGIVRQVEEVRREPGGPDFFHFSGQACDVGAFASQSNFSFTGGASAHREMALAKAVGEAVERYCGAQLDYEALPVTSYEEADFSCVHPERFALFSDAQYERPGFPWVPFRVDSPVRWVPAVELSSGARVHVPAGRVYVPYVYSARAGEAPIDQPISTGLACHLSFAEAAAAAICEVIERDGALIAWQARVSPPQIRVETLSDECYDLVRRFERTGGRVTLLDLTLDHGVPTIMAVLRSDQPLAPALVFAPATHLDPETATRKAIDELAHTRRYCQFVKLHAPRIEPDPPDYLAVHGQRDHLNFYVDHANAPLADFFFASERRIEFDEIENAATGDPERDLETLVARVREAGEEVYAVDVTTPDVAELGLHVVRAVIPGFQPLHMGFTNRVLGGTRLWEVPQRLGYAGVDRESGDYPYPHPYP